MKFRNQHQERIIVGFKIGITYTIALATHVDIRVLGCSEHPMTKLKIE